MTTQSLYRASRRVNQHKKTPKQRMIPPGLVVRPSQFLLIVHGGSTSILRRREEEYPSTGTHFFALWIRLSVILISDKGKHPTKTFIHCNLGPSGIIEPVKVSSIQTLF